MRVHVWVRIRRSLILLPSLDVHLFQNILLLESCGTQPFRTVSFTCWYVHRFPYVCLLLVCWLPFSFALNNSYCLAVPDFYLCCSQGTSWSFPRLANVDIASVNIHVAGSRVGKHFQCGHTFSAHLGGYQGLGLLGHMVRVCWVLWGSAWLSVDCHSKPTGQVKQQTLFSHSSRF